MRGFLTLALLLLLSSLAVGQVHSDAVRHKEAGNRFLKQREYVKARDQYLAAIRLDPAYEDAHYNLGVIYFFRMQDYPRALYHFVRYSRLVPEAEDLAQVRYLSIEALKKVEELDRRAYAAAVEYGTERAYERYLRDHPGSPYQRDAELRLQALKSR